MPSPGSLGKLKVVPPARNHEASERSASRAGLGEVSTSSQVGSSPPRTAAIAAAQWSEDARPMPRPKQWGARAIPAPSAISAMTAADRAAKWHFWLKDSVAFASKHRRHEEPRSRLASGIGTARWCGVPRSLRR